MALFKRRSTPDDVEVPDEGVELSGDFDEVDDADDSPGRSPCASCCGSGLRPLGGTVRRVRVRVGRPGRPPAEPRIAAHPRPAGHRGAGRGRPEHPGGPCGHRRGRGRRGPAAGLRGPPVRGAVGRDPGRDARRARRDSWSEGLRGAGLLRVPRSAGCCRHAHPRGSRSPSPCASSASTVRGGSSARSSSGGRPSSRILRTCCTSSCGRRSSCVAPRRWPRGTRCR